MGAKHATPLETVLVDNAFDAEVYRDEPLAPHTTYRVGGPARYFVQVNNLSALRRLITTCCEQEIAWAILGRGSNLLVSDEGYDGVAILLGRDFKNMHFDASTNRICAGAGVSLTAVVQEAYHRSLAGLEFLVGTPGSVGGAIRMNAGTRTQWIGNVVASVTSLSPSGEICKLDATEIEWAYRSSSLSSSDVVLECELALKPADAYDVRTKMDASLARRRETQPLDLPSCGSVFRNPEGKNVAELIESLGLKGFQIGGAQISEKHANFIVNTGTASAVDILALIETVRSVVRDRYGINLQTEVQTLGF